MARSGATIRYLLWDAGGTLFDSYPAKVTAIRVALRRCGASAPPARVRALLRESTGHTLRTLAADLDLEHAALEACYRDIYNAIEARRQPPFPGVQRVCRYILSSGGQNFIVTHRSRASLTALLKAHAMTDLFADCITADDDYPRKPAPTSLLAMVARHALDPAVCLVIGDRDLDIEAGRRAGLRTCYYGDQPHTLAANIEVTEYAVLYDWMTDYIA